MSKSLYGERDYAFGQRILTLRTQIGLTQAGLAEQLRISRRAVTEWEAGSSYPRVEHLQQLIALGVRASAFPIGREAEEIRALWKAAHQKVLLDEAWLASLLDRTRHEQTLLHLVPLKTPQPDEPSAVQPPSEPQVDWGEAPTVVNFYGREQELATLTHGVVEEGCRMISVLGIGGIGKSALVVRAMQQLAENFEVILFRSLRDAPSCEALLASCLSVLAPDLLALDSQSMESRLSLLLRELRSRRVLLVLDNLEVLLEEGDVLGRLRPGFEAYGHLLQQVAHTAHQSCLLLTSREKPAALRSLLGRGYLAMERAFTQVLERLPFAVKELHPDNGTEFFHYHLVRFWKERVSGVTLSRSRPYQKNDNRNVEQKNDTLVRHYFGELRLDTADPIAASEA